MSLLELSTYVSPSNLWEFIKQQAEKNGSQPVSKNLPDELALRIFGFLSPEELGRASCSCREWRRLASDQSLWDAFNLKELYPGFNVIDEKVWEKHIELNALDIDATGAPSLDNRTLIPVVSRLSKQVEGGAGVTLLTIPKGLTFDKLLELPGAPARGLVSKEFSEKFGDIPVDKTYVVAITNAILANSRNIYSEQEKLVNSLGCEMPRVLPVVALAVLTYVSSEKRIRLLPPSGPNCEGSSIYTRCLDKLKQFDFNLVVGCFTQDGLIIDKTIHAHGAIGVMALRKFEVIDDNSRSL